MQYDEQLCVAHELMSDCHVALYRFCTPTLALTYLLIRIGSQLGHGGAAWTVSGSIRTGVSISKRFMTCRPKGIPSTKWSSSLVNESLCTSIAGYRPLTLLAASVHQQQRALILQSETRS